MRAVRRLAWSPLPVLVLVLSGCFDAPRPNCSFLCGTAGECPEGYACSGDGRCHLELGGGELATCDDELPADASQPDAMENPIDAGPDAEPMPDATPPDAGPTTDHVGTVSVQDLTILNAPTLGHGLSIRVDLTGVDPVPPVFEDMPGSPLGCKVFVYDVTMGQVPPASADQGVVSITGATAVIPPCAFVASSGGYRCVAGGGGGTGSDAIVVGMTPAGTAMLVDSGAAGYTFSTDDVGRYISISGAGANSGAFPIVGVNTANNAVIYANPGASNAAFAGAYAVIAGLGPVPGAPSPEPLADTDTITVGITPGGGMEFDFADINVSVGDAFSLDAASAAALTDFPLDGNPLTLSCASGDCAAGTAFGSLVTITTTDGVIPPGTPDFFMPTPVSKMVVARCTAVGQGSVTLPAPVMQAIMSSGASRINTTFIRTGFAVAANSDGTNPVNVLAGHAVTGFSTDVGCVVPADCGADTDCLTRTCVNNVCGAMFTAVGTPTTLQTDGDCKERQCDGNGSTMLANDDTDLPDDNLECTVDVCMAGVGSNTPKAANDACTQGGGAFCDGAGACVECNLASQCGTDDECKSFTCNGSHVCVQNNTAAGTDLSSQTAGDCRVVECDGTGGTMSSIDNADLPVDSNQCTQDVCTTGTPSNPPEAANFACNQSGGTVCDGAGNCVECTAAPQCGTDDECKTFTCLSNACGQNNTAAGTDLSSQTTGDCKVEECDGAGGTQSNNDDADVPVDGNQCTQDVCTAGVPSNPARPLDFACNQSGGSFCDGAGVCVECNSPAQCGTDDECKTFTCLSNACGQNNTAAGTDLSSQTAGDCRVEECDGSGGTVSTVDDADLPVDGNECTQDVCTAGTPSNPNEPDGTLCTLGICAGGVCTPT